MAGRPAPVPEAGAPPRRSAAALAGIIAAMAVAMAVLLGLGTWQVERLFWKRDLVARVEARVGAAPVDAPGPAAWPGLDTAAEQYRRVRVAGTFLNDRETRVQAVTALGAGFWVLTPLRTETGFVVLVNRGFVPADRRDPASRRSGLTDDRAVVTGLMRDTEPKGGFLRSNDPAADRWYSRDVAAIVAARRLDAADGLGPVAPYFIDADATPNPGGYPVGGLTVVAFPNNHLVYALTWYGLALLLGGAAVRVVREERGARWARPAPALAGRNGSTRHSPGSVTP